MAAEEEVNWGFYLRCLSTNARESGIDPASDPSLLNSIRKLCDICREGSSEDLVARVYPYVNKLFHRCINFVPQSRASNGLFLLAILQFFLDFGEAVLHDSDPSLTAFFRTCLSQEFSDPLVGEATVDFIKKNKTKITNSFPSLLPQFFPLLLKLIAWNGEKVEKSFLEILPSMMSNGSFLPLFPSLIDLPILVMALEKVERSSGTLIGSSIASIQKSTAPEMLLALMDEAYTGSTIDDRGGDSGSDDNNTIDIADPSFLDILKDENDGLPERHRTSSALTEAIQAATNTSQSNRLKQALKMTPRLLDVYFSAALQDVNDSLICSVIPLIMSRNSIMFPDKNFSFEVRRRLLEFISAVFQRSPSFIALLKKPIIDRLGETRENMAKTELALNLCWVIGEHGAGGISHKNAARELFESLELLLYENLATSRLGMESHIDSNDAVSRKSLQVRLLCFVVTAIAKLATFHRELLPRARVSLSKVARSRKSDRRVWSRACDYLGLMNEPALCQTILGPTDDPNMTSAGMVNWHNRGSKMIAHIPFYILNEQEGPPFHDFSFSDILPTHKTSL
ncbi:hypothetical protein ZOSMA_38G00980 [Zostera marina]|uniref:AP-5 complex subunit zeta-1 n=1 Tax=Zostera marina TaxID=29655 RepID=A0A0K9P4Q7_ZOSMR|nr:hypothetical protein ZOSMA_38G00980 [Zostera marina]